MVSQVFIDTERREKFQRTNWLVPGIEEESKSKVAVATTTVNQEKKGWMDRDEQVI